MRKVGEDLEAFYADFMSRYAAIHRAASHPVRVITDGRVQQHVAGIGKLVEGDANSKD